VVLIGEPNNHPSTDVQKNINTDERKKRKSDWVEEFLGREGFININKKTMEAFKKGDRDMIQMISFDRQSGFINIETQNQYKIDKSFKKGDRDMSQLISLDRQSGLISTQIRVETGVETGDFKHEAGNIITPNILQENDKAVRFRNIDTGVLKDENSHAFINPNVVKENDKGLVNIVTGVLKYEVGNIVTPNVPKENNKAVRFFR
jgi:hypothetical protein